MSSGMALAIPDSKVEGVRTLIIFFSGDGTRANPEIVLGKECTLMMTYVEFAKKNQPHRRFRWIIRARKKKLREKRRKGKL